MLYEIRRVLKPCGVLEWIDEDPVFPLPVPSPVTGADDIQLARGLEDDFMSLLRGRQLRGSLKTVSKLLKGRALGMGGVHVKKIQLGLPRPSALLHPKDDDASPSSPGIRSYNTLRKARRLDYFNLLDDEKVRMFSVGHEPSPGCPSL